MKDEKTAKTDGTDRSTEVIVSEDDRYKVDADAIEELLVGFGEGNLVRVRAALNKLGRSENTPLHTRVDELTRYFHERMHKFRSSLSNESITMTATNIPDAAHKLEYVIKATNDASHKLFTLVERFERLVEADASRLSKFLNDLSGRHPEAADVVTPYEQEHAQWVTEARGLLSEMVMSQEFQDLCGQALSKVLKLVKELEGNLSSLVQQFGMDVVEGGPRPDETKVEQDGVDDLLKQFGF